MPIDSRVTLRKLEVFDAFARSGSVRGTAAALRVAQPAVSAHLRSLEARVGTALYRRAGRRLELTEAGHAVHAWAADLLDRTRQLERELDARAAAGAASVVIHASMAAGSYILPPMLIGIRRRRPTVEIALRVVGSEPAVRAVEEGACDFAVILSGAAPPGDHLTARVVAHEPLVVVAAPSAAPAAPLAPGDLAALDFIEHPEGYLRRTMHEGLLRAAGLASPRVVMELGHPEAIKQAVREGMGVAVMDRSSVAADVADGRLRLVDVRGLPMTVPVYVVVRRDRVLTGAQREVLELLEEEMGRRIVPPGPARHGD